MTEPIAPGAMRVPDIAGLLSRTPRRPMRDASEEFSGSESGPGDEARLAQDNAQDDPSGAEPEVVPVSNVGRTIGSNRRSVPRRPRSSLELAQPVGQRTGLADQASGEGATRPTREYLRMITVHLPRSVHQTLARQALTRETTRTALILEAVDATYTQIGAALAQQQGATEGNLFNIPQRRAAKDPLVEVKIRVTDRQLEAIQSLVQQNATSRSKLVSTALELHLAV